MSILDQVKYDLGAICDSGDIGTAVTYYPVDGLQVSTHVILRTEQSVSPDGLVIGSFLSAIIQRNDVATPQSGDTFMDSSYNEYKVLEIINKEDLFYLAQVEIING